ncbi:PilZ domain-containing protein [Dongia sp. agr-C8]
MSEYGKRATPVPVKALSSEALARWRSRERKLLSHEAEDHDAAPPATPEPPAAAAHSEAPASDAADPAHERHAERHMTLIGAQVVFNDLMSTYDCTIRDLSETGAKLKLHAPVQVPKAFLLRFGDGKVRRCKVRRRNALELGIEFLDQGS